MAAAMDGSSALGRLELSLDRPAEVVQLLQPERVRLVAGGVGEPGAIRFVPDGIEALVALGREDEAATIADWFDERACALDRAWARAAALRCRGLREAARGEGDKALAASRTRSRCTNTHRSRSSGPARCSTSARRSAAPSRSRRRAVRSATRSRSSRSSARISGRRKRGRSSGASADGRRQATSSPGRGPRARSWPRVGRTARWRRRSTSPTTRSSST